NDAYRVRFSKDLCISSGYRTLADQQRLKRTRGRMAAPPGKSNHGWGLAVDFCSSTVSGESQQWLINNGKTFGWVNPNWAKRGGTGPFEPCHGQFEEAVRTDGEYYGCSRRAERSGLTALLASSSARPPERPAS